MTHEEIVEEIVEEFRREVRFVSPCCSSTLYFGGNHHIFCHGCYKEVQLNSVITELGNKLRKKIRMTLTTTAQRVREEMIKQIEGMKTASWRSSLSGSEEIAVKNYNEAIDAVLSTLNK